MGLLISENDLWMPPPERLTLAAEEVHLWRASLAQAPYTVQTLLETLSPDERERAGKFHFHRDYESFVIARGVLRNIISRYVNVPPDELRFSYDRYGKPRLSSCETPLCFNLSHAKAIALYAVSRVDATGVDVEYVREDFATAEIAERFFSADELSGLRALPPELRTAGFFTCWTRKEAYIKALGEGLSHPLDRFTVSLVPGQPARLLSTDVPGETSRWTLMELQAGTGYIASLAIEGKVGAVRYWQWG